VDLFGPDADGGGGIAPSQDSPDVIASSDGLAALYIEGREGFLKRVAVDSRVLVVLEATDLEPDLRGVLPMFLTGVELPQSSGREGISAFLAFVSDA
jgi:hypothetical protein